jgi:alanine-synthesizing transaminase
VSAPRFRFSRRFPWEHERNRLTLAMEERAARGLEAPDLIDLTETNPTRVGLAYPEEELAELLRRGASSEYPPHPRGIPEAREALAAALSTPGDAVSPEDLVLTASTSESYSWLFKLFADPGDEVLTAAPSYPLLDSLAALDSLVLSHVHLRPGRRFVLDPEAVELALTERTRLLALVHPGNPTGRFLSVAEQEAVAALCAARDLPLISDEVFADYSLEDGPRAGPAAARGHVLAFSLGGLSKSAGLPGWKLGWIRAGGPPDLRRRALAGLEMVADTYLSVATPAQRALGGVLALAPKIRAAILARVRGNLALLRAALAEVPGAELLEPEGGWAAVIRVSHPVSDEELALDLLDRAGVLVHPGYFFDFTTDDFLVLSLLPEPGRFAEGVGRLASHLGERPGHTPC